MSKKIDIMRALVVSGDLARAKAMGEKLCKRTRNAELLLLMAIVTVRLGDVNQAIDYAQQSIKVDRLYADAYFFLATAYREQNEIDSAIQYVKRGLVLNPHSGEGHNKLGVFLRQQNKNEEAASSFRLAIRNDPDNAFANFNLGCLLHQKMDLVGARKVFSRALQINSALAEAHKELGIVLFKQGELEQSLESLKRAISIKHDYAEAYSNMGQVLDLLGKRDRAMNCLRKAVQISPESLDMRNILATTLLESGESGWEEAIVEFRKMLDIESDHVSGLIGLAHAYLYLGQEDSCIKFTQRILEQHSDSEAAMAGVASVYDRLGRFEDAFSCLRSAIENGITTASAALLFASICRHVSQCDSAIEQIENLLSDGTLAPSDRRQLSFSVAQLYDHRGDYNKAFRYYEKANKLKFCPFHSGETAKKIDALLEVYSESFLKTAPHSTIKSDKIIFIVGMPRSGTSLMEQVLDSHSQVFGAGELVYLARVLKQMQENHSGDKGYPFCMQDITVETLSEMANRYLDCLPEGSNQYLRVTDKLPQNFLHLGAVEMLFPNARIIHCKRDPLDTCLSCYFQDFSGYLNFAYNLKHLGFYYQQYLKLMEHWKRVLNIPVLEMQYEDMVADTEQSVRSVLEFCDLPWEDACLDFYKSSRIVNTASYDQVRRPIYKGSIGRWKNYSKTISPLKKALGVE